MFTNQCFSQRLFNKKRRLTSIIIQFIDDRERSKKMIKSTNQSIIVLKSSLFFYYFCFKKKSFRFEQHDNYDDFDFDIEIERLVFEFSNVVSITKKTKISKNQFSKIDKNRISTSRSRVVKRFLSFF